MCKWQNKIHLALWPSKEVVLLWNHWASSVETEITAPSPEPVLELYQW